MDANDKADAKMRAMGVPVIGRMHGLGDRIPGSYHATLEDRERVLPAHMIREIRNEEGLKSAGQVGRDFRIDSTRVRDIWDRIE